MKVRLVIMFACMAAVMGVLFAILPALGVPTGAPSSGALEAQPGEVTPDGWEVLAAGIHYREYHLSDPNNVYVARMERSVLSNTLESSIASGYLASGRETTSGMAARYDQAINYWGQTWGQRNRVVVAINGSFFDWDTGLPQSGLIHSGWYDKRFDDLFGGSGLAWKSDRSIFIGECVYHRPEKQKITLTSSGLTMQITAVNVPRSGDNLVLYTPQYDIDTNTEDAGVEVLVEMTRPTLVLPSSKAFGYVRQIRVGLGSTPIPFDHVVLSASGSAADTLLANVNLGDEIGFNQEITHLEHDCETPLGLDWTKTYASIGGSFHFLKDGDIQYANFIDDPNAVVPDPRTAIVYNDAYVYFIVVDGRDDLDSRGMTIEELALFSRDVLSATNGLNQDGGGSSTMVVNGQVMNNAFCNEYHCRSKAYLPIVIRPDSGAQPAAGLAYPLPGAGDGLLPEPLGVSSPQAVNAPYQRWVANGMMMVVVEPMTQTVVFTPTQEVGTVTTTEVRLGPGTNYAALTSVAAGAQGVIVSHALNGVLAKGYSWWKVDFSGLTGWVREDMLTPIVPLFRLVD